MPPIPRVRDPSWKRFLALLILWALVMTWTMDRVIGIAGKEARRKALQHSIERISINHKTDSMKNMKKIHPMNLLEVSDLSQDILRALAPSEHKLRLQGISSSVIETRITVGGQWESLIRGVERLERNGLQPSETHLYIPKNPQAMAEGIIMEFVFLHPGIPSDEMVN